jgi:large-conductance mechanosensitive channel
MEDNNVIQFITRERWVSITVLGGVFTFAFISSLKEDIIDPLMLFMLPTQNFDFMNIVIREGEKFESPERQLELRFGHFFRASCTWFLMLAILFVLYKFTNFPDIKEGNRTGAAIP